MLELMTAGLPRSEALQLGMEELLCVLCHRRFAAQLDTLDSEAARIAGLPFAEAQSQQRLLSALQHRQRAVLDRFYREQQEEQTWH
jgi:hypothetical protein